MSLVFLFKFRWVSNCVRISRNSSSLCVSPDLVWEAIRNALRYSDKTLCRLMKCCKVLFEAVSFDIQYYVYSACVLRVCARVFVTNFWFAFKSHKKSKIQKTLNYTFCTNFGAVLHHLRRRERKCDKHSKV